VRLDGERLILTAGSVTLVLQETTAPSDLPLMGTTWVVVGVGSGDSIRHDNGGAPATVRLHDGRADVFDGCNIGTGTAVVEGNVVRFSELDRTKKACDPTAELLEYSVVMVLQGDVTARVEGRSLVLASGDHSLLLEAADS
jgi:heat shock protein HslJ